MIEGIPRVRLELRPSRIDFGGVGVFAFHGFNAGQKVADGIAEEDFTELVSWGEYSRLDTNLQRKIMAFCVGTPEGFIPPPDFDFNRLSIEWYLNHCCEGNCGFDEDGDFVAIRNIEKGEELSYDYALIESNPRFSMKCNCGKQNCRQTVTGNDWKDEEFVARNRDHMHPRLRRLLAIPA
ncbi:MAG: SET domain-containing protein-lysine N-methyltransferase [Candidatus Acidiferrum sp.]